MGVATAIGIGAGVSALSSYYSAKKAGDLNEKSIAAQSNSEERTRQAQLQAQERDLAHAREQDAQSERARIETQQLAATTHKDDVSTAERARTEDLSFKKQQYEEAVARDRARYDAYVQANTPYWQVGSRVLGSLFDLAQVGGPPSATPTGPASVASLPASAPSGAAPSRASLPSSAAAATAPSANGLSSATLADIARYAGLSKDELAASAGPIRSARASIATGKPMPRMTSGGGGGMSLMDLLKLYDVLGGGANLSKGATADVLSGIAYQQRAGGR